MIQNLLTAVLVSMAVGGNTATAFHKEPQQVIAQTHERILYETWDQQTFIDDNPQYQLKNIPRQDPYIDNYQVSKNFKDIGYYSPRWEIFSRTLWNNYQMGIVDNNSQSIFSTYLYEELTLIRVDSYVDITQLEIYNPATIVLDIKQANIGNCRVNYVDSYAYQQIYVVNNERTYLDTLMGGQRPSEEAYQITTLSQLRNNIITNETPTIISEHEYTINEDIIIGSEVWDSATTTSVMRTNYLIVYTQWYQDEVDWDQYDNNLDDDYNIMVYPTRMTQWVDMYYNYEVVDPSGSETTTIVVNEIVDIPNLMYTIITMPFSFISTAFNLTLFQGTPYAVNIGNIILLILTILIVLFVVRIILRFLR